jgi:hypothetical protein
MTDVCEHAPAWFAEMVMPTVSIGPGRESDLLAIDPGPCEWCGLTIDRHEMIDHGEGPVFFCADLSPDEMTLPELERRAELIRQVEVAAIFARLEAADDPSKRPPLAPRAEPYRTLQVTIDAFWYVVGLDDPDRLKTWMRDHPKDAPTLLKLLESK